ncbi:uncharacterized protein LOC18443875 [Amborella trichopoda]|uniref:uncharacterized protein LOC18443875 n=1 Tax=Amborella trichopoda TaxID=13333 RepID=UPI0005D32076|nr:uncharacterized protein LOC18443875 [Amborella trichopoda]|eukprot:XP_011626942.1 uncharacterized protein LOC18443875 [Amborella trichopoda]
MRPWRTLRPCVISALQKFTVSPSSSHHFSPVFHGPHVLPINGSISKTALNFFSTSIRVTKNAFATTGAQSPFSPSMQRNTLLMNQCHHFSSKERKRTKVTPVTSKLKKTKMKSYSSYKSRFRTMNDGSIRRWRAGKRHNAHLKSKKAKRRLRQPALVHAAYAKVMKKLNFCG